MSKAFAVYHNGLKIDGAKCKRCGVKVSGIVMQNRIRWVIYAECGHLLMRGSVLPLEALEAMKLANQKQSMDPRALSMAKHNADMDRRQKVETFKKEWLKDTFTKGSNTF